eukprot:CAMPEP_0198234664 /NCGR_PEP_ID=MMETSP1446-20131203/631_1 /TAXON_ID=1461542 ORGANISM="Unidentified sp, Strain CCMP2111" /NCGR_SAMPLE_ID=MMETSP1446 /ASSEMBLY_ACC=CAM_ASM_001112 /LENGTH=344 /DNA_ID=CAMNT_0043915483 /DNA_START=409 /DNA_END=1443 /DNA_ORIENTATION=-
MRQGSPSVASRASDSAIRRMHQRPDVCTLRTLVKMQATVAERNSTSSRGASQRGSRVEVYRAEGEDYPRVARFLVESFYTDSRKPENNLAPWMQRSLEQDQNRDLRSRYNRTGCTRYGIESIIVTAEREEADQRGCGGELLGCVAMGTTPFVGRDALLEIKDLDAYPSVLRARQKQLEESGAVQGNVEPILRPIVANLAVAKRSRRKGVAKKLMRQCEDIARSEWGYDEIWLLVEDDNRKAKKLYKKLGYKTIRKNPDTSFKVVDGRVTEVDVTNVYMRKILKPGVVGFVMNTDWLQFGLFTLMATLGWTVLSRTDDGSREVLLQLIRNNIGTTFDTEALMRLM